MTLGDALPIAIVTGGISFAAAVVAVVLGQSLARRFQDQADNKRWLRSDSDRRRVRAEEAAEQILETVDEVSELLKHGTGRGHDPPDQEALRPAYRTIRKAAARIPDDEVQRLSDVAADILYYYRPDEGWFRETRYVLGRVLETEIRAVMGAYLTNQPIPSAPRLQALANELDAHERWLEEAIADDEASPSAVAEGESREAARDVSGPQSGGEDPPRTDVGG